MYPEMLQLFSEVEKKCHTIPSEHGLWVEYAAYFAELFGLQMAYGLATLSVL